MAISYEKINAAVNYDLSECSLEMAVEKIGPSFIYNLYVGDKGYISSKHLLRDLSLTYAKNPFSPYFNIMIDSEFDYDEWCVEANGKIFGSKGA